MAVISSEDTRILGRLARLSLTDHEVVQFSSQLETILEYIALLQEVDVEGVPEWHTPPTEGSALRDDSEGPTFTAEVALAAVPKRRGRLVVVPKFKED